MFVAFWLVGQLQLSTVNLLQAALIQGLNPAKWNPTENKHLLAHEKKSIGPSPIVDKISIDSAIFALNKRQAITWTSDDPLSWCLGVHWIPMC